MGILNLFRRKKQKKPEQPKIRHVEHKQNSITRTIIKRFYSGYPEIPYIAVDREGYWIHMAEMFQTHSVIPKSMMTRYDDDLLPGHVYMLYWLGKYTKKEVPAYFEYKYGVDFEEEQKVLREYGFLDENNKPTIKGLQAIEAHHEVIENHSPKKPDRSIKGISKRITEAKNSYAKMGFDEYLFQASPDSCEKCKALDKKRFKISEFKIGVNAPPMHEKCRCSISAYVDDEEYETWIDSIDKGSAGKK